MGYEDKVVDEGMKKHATARKKVRKKLGLEGLSKKDTDTSIKNMFKPKDPRMKAGKFRTFGSSRAPKKVDKKGNVQKASGGTVRRASGGPVVDSYDYS